MIVHSVDIYPIKKTDPSMTSHAEINHDYQYSSGQIFAKLLTNFLRSFLVKDNLSCE